MAQITNYQCPACGGPRRKEMASYFQDDFSADNWYNKNMDHPTGRTVNRVSVFQRLPAIAALVLLLLATLTACGEKEAPTIEKADSVVLTGDSYWVLEESEGDMRQDTPDGDDLLTDLTLWADGTARIREIESDVWLRSDGDEQNMTWRCEEDGSLLFYTSRSGDEPYWSGKVTEAGIELSRFGGTYRFTRADMPQ
ncbi:MAG: hypothetical protein IKU12_03285, partial [Oscillospiraceae bacterium]|nr:hypothetical protein [Oscillospiraceae bacterium]